MSERRRGHSMGISKHIIAYAQLLEVAQATEYIGLKAPQIIEKQIPALGNKTTQTARPIQQAGDLSAIEAHSVRTVRPSWIETRRYRSARIPEGCDQGTCLDTRKTFRESTRPWKTRWHLICICCEMLATYSSVRLFNYSKIEPLSDVRRQRLNLLQMEPKTKR